MRFLARVIRILSIASLFMGILLLHMAIFENSKELRTTSKENIFLYIIMGVVLALAGAGLFNFSRKLTVRNWQEISRNDTRPPVLYLRSFQKDKDGDKTSTHAWWKKFMYLFTTLPANLTTQEEQIKIAFDDIGPMLAVAKPDALFNSVGAVRIKYKNEEWQREVMKLMQKASIVLIRAEGITTGLVWEIEQVFKIKEPGRIIFLLPKQQKEYDLFSDLMLQKMNIGLPVFIVKSAVSDFSGLLYFSSRKLPLIEPFRDNGILSPSGQTFNNISIHIKKALARINSTMFNTYQYRIVTITERLKAFLYDLTIIIPVCLLMVGVCMFIPGMNDNNMLAGIGIITFGVIQFLYPLFADWYSVKGTFGKRKLGFYISDKEHVKPSAQQIWIRHIWRMLTLFPPLWLFLIPLTILGIYKKWPLLHDYGSRTRVFSNALPSGK